MTEQSDRWGNDFGEEYTHRNPNTPDEMQALYRTRFGVERTAMNEDFLGGLDKSMRILEVGCNVGTQLNLLSRMGFENLYGIEINPVAIERSHEVNKGLPIQVVCANALGIPFNDGYFDLVYTSGVLIHISPPDIAGVMREMARCSSRHIWGFEYYTPEGHIEIPYRGHSNMLWKTDFARLFERTCPEFKLVRETFHPYSEDPELVDQMYLLDKEG